MAHGSVHSDSLALGTVTLAAGTPSTRYTVPADIRTIVKELVATRLTGTASPIYWVVTRGAVTVEVAHVAVGGAAVGSLTRWPVWFVLEEGDDLRLQAGNAGDFSFMASGSELDV